ncbi:MAG: hypothetical protein C4532_05745 [Candidatus Abyssobacteria bacterium SURF_17]|uniref:Uncharacterized protein n=1 Tax=Candidatus Abyssobacteria bacterium SURF_17 TaxID=2093361 RepID=A0A419F2Z8_9BACT|nr:MAG: hypothetical protein C4532_05745 [Candidatus Abyssubacteria bacterium SURF_17]
MDRRAAQQLSSLYHRRTNDSSEHVSNFLGHARAKAQSIAQLMDALQAMRRCNGFAHGRIEETPDPQWHGSRLQICYFDNLEQFSTKSVHLRSLGSVFDT